MRTARQAVPIAVPTGMFMKLTPSFFPWLVVVFFITKLLHESAHGLMGAALGIDMRFGLNVVRYITPAEPWQRMLADAAGPVVTILQGVLAYVLVRRSASPTAFAFLSPAWSAFSIRTTRRASACISDWVNGPCRSWLPAA